MPACDTANTTVENGQRKRKANTAIDTEASCTKRSYCRGGGKTKNDERRIVVPSGALVVFHMCAREYWKKTIEWTRNLSTTSAGVLIQPVSEISLLQLSPVKAAH